MILSATSAPAAAAPLAAVEWLPITSPAGVLAVLAGVCALAYWVEKATKWRLFEYLPPLVFIYATPAVLSNLGVIPAKGPVHDGLDSIILPMMLVLLLLNMDVVGAVRGMGRGVAVMLFGTLGVVLGAPVGLLLVNRWLGPDAWKAFGSLAGSWVGGTANLAAVSEMVEADDTQKGLAVLGDATMYSIWLPILLSSKRFAERFARFTRVDADRIVEIEAAATDELHQRPAPTTFDYLSLLAVAFTVAWLSEALSPTLPVRAPYLSASTWRILLVTTFGVLLSMTPLRRIGGSRELGMALVLIFMAHMGASADFSGIASQAAPFLLGCAVWITIHGLFCLLGAKLMRVDIHTAAAASAANIGGVAAASVVAAFHKESLVPAAILMALLGYALGNYAGYATALLCQWVT
jgi:uncharacterized membrane protein